MEPSLLHVQGNVLRHVRVQGALRVRLLEKLADRRQEGKKAREGDGAVRADHEAVGPAAQEGPDRIHQAGEEAQRRRREGADRVKKKPPRELVVPDDLAKASKRNKAAQATFDKFSPSNKREYVDWITEAKTEATRTRRLETAIEWMAEGKTRNWKYMNC